MIEALLTQFQIILKCGDCGMESDGFHASVDHMGEYHPQYFDGDKQAICIFCLKVSYTHVIK